jgi:hypothetical protein
VGLIIAVAAFFTGPSAAAVSTRRAFSSALGGVRARGKRAGLRSGPAGRWVSTHRRGLQVTAVAIAALVLVFWSQPTWQIALAIAIVLLLVLGLIELIARSRPNHVRPASTAVTEPITCRLRLSTVLKPWKVQVHLV